MRNLINSIEKEVKTFNGIFLKVPKNEEKLIGEEKVGHMSKKEKILFTLAFRYRKKHKNGIKEAKEKADYFESLMWENIRKRLNCMEQRLTLKPGYVIVSGKNESDLLREALGYYGGLKILYFL